MVPRHPAVSGGYFEASIPIVLPYTRSSHSSVQLNALGEGVRPIPVHLFAVALHEELVDKRDNTARD